MGLRSDLNAILDFLFPKHLVCHCCGREAIVNEWGICEKCEKSLGLCLLTQLNKYLDGIRSGMLYQKGARKAIISLKFGGALYKSEFLVHYMDIPDTWEFDYVVPVPLGKKRLRKRGYNQSEVLAKGLCERYNLVMKTDALARVKDTVPQTRVAGADREKNLKGAFKGTSECCGKSFLLVDDVKTTGATLESCAKELKRCGAVRVYAITACAAVSLENCYNDE